MRILFFRGSFSWDGENTHTGLICLCHLHKEDDSRTLEVAKSKIQNRLLFQSAGAYGIDSGYERAVLIPFSCLDKKDNVMDFLKANSFFKKLGESIPDSISMPFASSKEIHLDMADMGSYVQYIEVLDNNKPTTTGIPYKSKTLW
jgi:hypothetical protein